MVRLFSAGFLLLRFLMAICHTSSAEHAPCPTTVEKHRRFSKAWARLQSLDGPGWHSALQQHVLPLYEKRPDYEKTSTAVQAWVAGSGIAPDRAGVALPPGLPCKLRLAALLNSVFWVLEKEWKCGKFAGYNVAPMWTDFESVYSALMHALLLLNHRQVAAADVVLNDAFDQLGFDWAPFDQAYLDLPRVYGPRWWQTGGRRCWDELVLLSRLMAPHPGHNAALLADYLNGYSLNAAGALPRNCGTRPWMW